MEFLFLAILIGAFLLLSVKLVPYAAKGHRQSFILALTLSVVLVPVTILLLTQNHLVLSQQNEAIEWVARKWESSSATEKKYKWATDHFIFIDVSNSHQLVEEPGGNQLANATISITDRKELASLFQLLKSTVNQTDLIICDMYLDTPSPDDSLLRETLSEATIQSKLLLGQNPVRPNLDYFSSFNQQVYGNIMEETEHNLFSSYKAYAQSQPGIAYSAYLRMENIQTSASNKSLILDEKKPERWKAFSVNSFIPLFELTDEKKLYTAGENNNKEEEQAASSDNYFKLGDILATDLNKELFTSVLDQRKKEGKRNVVFIGAFTSEETDIHDTHYGKMHGPSIQLNILYALMQHQHRINVWFILYLLAGMTATLYIAIVQAVKLPFFLTSRKKRDHSRVTPRSMLLAIWDILIVDELHVWLFILFVFITAMVWGKIINGFVLLLLLMLLLKVFRYYYDETNK